MVFEIVRKNLMRGTVGLRFPGDVPVEVREAMIKAGFRWDSYDGLWKGEDRDNIYIKALIAIGEDAVNPRHAMTKAEEASLKAEYMEKIAGNENDHWKDYYAKEIGVLVKLTDGRIVNIMKPRIKTEFCYGESGYDMDDASHMADVARNSEKHFRDANLRHYREMIEILSRKFNPENSRYYDVWVSEACWNKPGIVEAHTGMAWDRMREEPIPTVSEEDRERLLEGYRKAYAAFEKRINAYLKRYGLSKVVSWTYWRDA